MKGILAREFGGPEVLKYETNLNIPEPNDDQIQIRVYAAGVNPVETYIRKGTGPVSVTLPYTPGFDAAGVISKLGKNVKNFKVGDRVYTACNFNVSGSYAEYTLSTPTNTFKLEDSLTFEEGSAIGVPYFTGYRALFLLGNAKPGEVCLIHGASGATGLASLQLAKAVGLKVIGTAGSTAGLALVKEQGADHVFNHREPNYMDQIKALYPDGVDIVLEMLADSNLNNDMQILRFKKGRVMIIGNRGTIEINPGLLMRRETRVCGIILFESTPEDLNLTSHHLEQLFRSKAIKPVLAKKYELKDASKAHHDIINNSASAGRLTLLI